MKLKRISSPVPSPRVTGASVSFCQLQVVRMTSPGLMSLLAEDVKLPSGVLLVARGYEITAGVVERMRKFPVQRLLRVMVRTGG